MNKLIEKLAALPKAEWKFVSSQVAWIFRKGGVGEWPDVIAKGGTPPDREAWDRIRRAVNATRRFLKAEREAREAQERRERRRAYMQKYMQEYRKATDRHAAEGTDGSNT